MPGRPHSHPLKTGTFSCRRPGQTIDIHQTGRYKPAAYGRESDAVLLPNLRRNTKPVGPHCPRQRQPDSKINFSKAKRTFPHTLANRYLGGLAVTDNGQDPCILSLYEDYFALFSLAYIYVA